MKRSRDTALAADADERPCTEVIVIPDSEECFTAVSTEDGADDAEVQSPTAHPVELFLLSVHLVGSERNNRVSSRERWGTPSPLAVTALEQSPLFKRLVEVVARGHVGATPWVVRLDLTATYPESDDSRHKWFSQDDRLRDFTDDALEDELDSLADSAPRCTGTIVGTIDMYVRDLYAHAVLKPAEPPPAAEDRLHDDVRAFLECAPLFAVDQNVIDDIADLPENDVETYIRDNLLSDEHEEFDVDKVAAFLTDAPKTLVGDVYGQLQNRGVAFFEYAREEDMRDDAQRTFLRKMKSREWGFRELFAYAGPEPAFNAAAAIPRA